MKRGHSFQRLIGPVFIGMLLWGLGSSSGWAQALPGTDSPDLTLPPEMRPGAAAPPSQQRPEKRHRVGKTAPRAESETTAVPRHAAAEPPHPVELGVTMRGGSGTPRVYGATGTSEAIQESGSAFGAAMRFGF